jgi:hypothetical protein
MNKLSYIKLITKKILLKSLNPNLKSSLERIFNFWFQNLLINIAEYNSRSKRTYMIFTL